MYFKASEVVPIYFCLFALSGVAGSGLAYGELTMPWVLMLFPGVAFCIGGVFAISHRRDERIARQVTRTMDTTNGDAYLPPAGSEGERGGRVSGVYHANVSGRRESYEQLDAERRASGMCAFVADNGGSGGDRTSGLMNQGAMGPPMGVPHRGLSAVDLAALHHRPSDVARTTAMSEACSVCSVASAATAASLEESAFFALGGGAFSSFNSVRRMANPVSADQYMPFRRDDLPFTPERPCPSPHIRPHSRAGGAYSGALPAGDASDVRGSCVREALLPRCSEASTASLTASHAPSREVTRNSDAEEEESQPLNTPYQER